MIIRRLLHPKDVNRLSIYSFILNEPLYYRRHRHTATYHTNHQRTHISESDLVTARSTAYAPPEDGLMGRPKHVGGNLTKIFLTSF